MPLVLATCFRAYPTQASEDTRPGLPTAFISKRS